MPSRGSVGASGDLAPLAHLALVLIGEGEGSVDEDDDDNAETAEHAKTIRLCASRALRSTSISGAEALRRAGCRRSGSARKKGWR